MFEFMEENMYDRYCGIISTDPFMITSKNKAFLSSASIWYYTKYVT
jgi:hypothetical protein